MQLVIVAGGKGTRLRERLGPVIKPMVPLDGKPLLEHQLQLAKRHGFGRVLLLLGNGAQSVIDYFGSGGKWGMEIESVVEDRERGTAGAVLAARHLLDERFLLMYGDTVLNVDLSRFWLNHVASGADASLFVHPNDHPYDSDLVETDEADRIVAFHPCPRDEGYYANLVNAALYVMEKRALPPAASSPAAMDFGRDLFPAMLRQGQVLHGYRSPEYIKDAGTRERLDAVTADYFSGRVAAGSFATSAPAIFFDRDGTLNREAGNIACHQRFELLDGAGAAVRRANLAGYRVVVVTNQPVVARGECSEGDLARIHAKLETLLGRDGAYADLILYCPHHPDRGFPGERPDLKIPCGCRKPATGLIELACQKLNIDVGRTWMIGDRTVDVQTAVNAGLRSILVETGCAGRDGKFDVRPDFVAPSLDAAVAIAMGARP